MFEKILLKHILKIQELKNVVSIELEHTDSDVFLKYRTIKQVEGQIAPLQKDYKRKITSFVQKHGSLMNFYEAIVASSMIIENYSIIPIENGWLCTGGDEVYNLEAQECTCKAFQANKNTRCKHLVYRDWTLKERAKIAQLKRNLS